MSFTLETGTGVAAANAYISVADVDAYMADRGQSEWAAASTTEKEAAIVRATRWVDATYRARFPGARLNGRGQGLEWPRKDAQDAAGDDVAADEVPAEVVQATAEAALREVQSPGSLLPDVTPGQQKTLVAVEGIRWQSNASGGAGAQKPVLHVVDGIMAPLIGASAGQLLRA